MAFDYLCFFANEANTLADLQIGRFGVNPYREAHFDPAFYQTEMGWDANVATTYTDTLKAIDTSDNQVFDLRVPGVGEFMSSMAAGVARAQSGEATAQEALDGVAAEWTAIVDRIGVDRVRAAYANVVALEDRLKSAEFTGQRLPSPLWQGNRSWAWRALTSAAKSSPPAPLRSGEGGGTATLTRQNGRCG